MSENLSNISYHDTELKKYTLRVLGNLKTNLDEASDNKDVILWMIGDAKKISNLTTAEEEIIRSCEQKRDMALRALEIINLQIDAINMPGVGLNEKELKIVAQKAITASEIIEWVLAKVQNQIEVLEQSVQKRVDLIRQAQGG
jgi:hypothetical protein